MTTAEQPDVRTGISPSRISLRWVRIIPVASHYVHDRLYRSYKHISCLAAYQPGPPFGSAAAGTVAGIFFWGYLALQFPEGIWPSTGVRRIYQRSIACMGPLCDRLRLGPYLSRTFVAPVASGVAESGVYRPTLILLRTGFPVPSVRAPTHFGCCACRGRYISIAFSGWILDHWNWRVMLVAEGSLPFLWLAVWLVLFKTIPRRRPGFRKATRFPGGNLAPRIF